jgi:hypothetical protein
MSQTIAELRIVADRINAFFAGPWVRYREAVEKANVTFFEPVDPIVVEP